MIRVKAKASFFLGVGLTALAALLLRQPASAPAKTPDQTPLILERVTKLSELRLARHTYTTTSVFESSKSADGAFSMVPAVQNLVTATTKNEAVVTIRAEIDAAIDMSQATVSRNGDVYTITLPHAKLSKPVLDAKLNAHRPGLLWRDSEIALKAIDDAKDKVRRAATARRITQEAEQNAKAALAPILPAGLTYRVEFQAPNKTQTAPETANF